MQREGVKLDGVWYYNPKFAAIIGEKVEVRRGLDDAGKVHIFDVKNRVYQFDAENLVWSGNVEEDIQRVNKLRKEARELQAKYNKKKAEYDAGPFQTPSELYAQETARQTELKVVNGESLNPDTGNPTLLLTLVKMDEAPKRRIRLPTDPD